MPIHIPKKVPDLDYYIIGDFTTAATGGAIIQFVLIK